MKKFFTLFLVVAAVSALAIGFAACGGETLSGTYVYKETRVNGEVVTDNMYEDIYKDAEITFEGDQMIMTVRGQTSKSGYSLDGNVLSAAEGYDGNVAGTMYVEGDELILSLAIYGETTDIIFVKQ